MSRLRVERVQAGVSPPRVRVMMGERKLLLSVDEAIAFRDELDAAIDAAQDPDEGEDEGWL